MLERFIDRGYELDRLTAMHDACCNHDVSVEVLELLLDKGAIINSKDWRGNSVIMTAVRNNGMYNKILLKNNPTSTLSLSWR